LLPEENKDDKHPPKPMKVPETEEFDDESINEPWRTPNFVAKQKSSQKFLFTVKPGGIAGYLGAYSVGSLQHFGLPLTIDINLASLCSTSSYVDIKAKTDTYVGFLPAQALERILEKRPIVLLTLAKRLISMLSPLGMYGFSASSYLILTRI
jgi:lysophospholipid hydrolase